MANEQRLQQLAERLAQATQEGKLTWSASDDDRFQLSLPSGAIAVDRRRGELVTMHVYDDSGNRVEALEEVMSVRPWDDALRSLWEAARNSALNIDHILDSIISDVEKAKTTPADDDIPF